jgi:hypothetical protein
MFVINAIGEQEEFSRDKIISSLMRAGIKEEASLKIANEIETKAYPDISTYEIYKLIKKRIKKEKSGFRFDLKASMKQLGPDGFIFEKFIKEIFEFLGFEVIINQYLKGRCITYEMDIIAEDKKKKYIGECKFRNKTGDRVDLNIPMKMFAVMDDVLNTDIKGKNKLKPIIITNEKFTTHAIKYAKCKKIKLLGWNFPVDAGLERIIEDYKLYPITILPSFKDNHLHFFAENGILLVKDIKDNKKIISDTLGNRQFSQLLKESLLILN